MISKNSINLSFILILSTLTIYFIFFGILYPSYLSPHQNEISCNRYDYSIKIYTYSEEWVKPNVDIKYKIFVLPNKNTKYNFEEFNLYKWIMEPDRITEENKIYDYFYKNINKSGSFRIYKEGYNIVNFMVKGFEKNDSEGLTICIGSIAVKVHPPEYQTSIRLQMISSFIATLAVVISTISLLHSTLSKK